MRGLRNCRFRASVRARGGYHTRSVVSMLRACAKSSNAERRKVCSTWDYAGLKTRGSSPNVLRNSVWEQSKGLCTLWRFDAFDFLCVFTCRSACFVCIVDSSLLVLHVPSQRSSTPDHLKDIQYTFCLSTGHHEFPPLTQDMDAPTVRTSFPHGVVSKI